MKGSAVQFSVGRMQGRQAKRSEPQGPREGGREAGVWPA